MEKAETRAWMRAQRRALPPDYVAAANAAIRRHLAASPLVRGAGTLLAYVASKENEVDTLGPIADALARGQHVLVPVTRADGIMVWTPLTSLDALRPARFGILEPAPPHPAAVPPARDGVVLVPGVAFRADGHRIGYGKGHFDRFLALCALPSIGLAYARVEAPTWPPDPHDVPVRHIATEEGVVPASPA